MGAYRLGTSPAALAAPRSGESRVHCWQLWQKIFIALISDRCRGLIIPVSHDRSAQSTMQNKTPHLERQGVSFLLAGNF